MVLATKKKIKDGQAVLIHLDENTIARLKRFQAYMDAEQGISMKNAPSVKFLVSQGLKEFEKRNTQLDLIGEISAKKKKKR